MFAYFFFFTSCKRDEFTVTFDPNGGDGTIITQNFTEKVAQSLIANTFNYKGFTFHNWNTTPDGTGKTYRDREMIEVSEQMVLYAQWIPFKGTCFVTFNANGGTGTMAQQLFTGFESQPLTANAFTYIDHTFFCWNSKTDGSGDRYRDQEKIEVVTNIVLYAQWFSTPKPCPDIPEFTDIDGNTYNTVQIGSQCWMKENLKTTKYKTGEDIPIGIDDWYDTTGSMYYYNNDISNAAIYGALYNAFAVNTNNLCPEGWHVPSSGELTILANALGGENIAGYKMKTDHGWSGYWGIPDGNGSNESGFSALPAGYYGSYDNSLGNQACFWSTTADTYFYQQGGYLYNSSNSLYIGYFDQRNGLSVRCIKD